jgi:hypothetical protein
MRKVLLASVAVLGLAAMPVMAQTTLNSNDSAKGSVNTPAGGANVGGSGSLSGSTNDIHKSSPSGTTSGTRDRDRDRSLATVPDRGDKNNTQMRDKDNNSAKKYAPGQRKGDDNSARDYAPGQMKKDR